MTAPDPSDSPGVRGRDRGLTSRPARWNELTQRVRAHRPSELLPAIAAAGAQIFDGGPLKFNRGGMHPWVLAGIARESLAYGNEHRGAPVTAGSLAVLHNIYADLDDPFLRPDTADGPWDVILRVAYEQLGWQGASFPEMARIGALLDRDFGPGYEVLSRDALTDLLGADPGSYFGATFVFTVGAQVNSGRFDLAWLDQPQFRTICDVIPAPVLRDVFARSFGASSELLGARARADRNPQTELRKHDPNPLAATPYVEITPGLHVAPVTKLVADRASLKAVYHLGQAKWRDPFTRDLGRLVESYAGEQLALIPHATLTPERPYGRNGASKTVDWLLVLPEAVLLIEVKSARVAHRGRIDQRAFIDDVERDVGKGFRQVATTAGLIRAGHPVVNDVPTDRPLRGIVVTAEPHFLINSATYRLGLDDPTVPTVVLSLEELEHAVSLTLNLDPSAVMLAITQWDPETGTDLSRNMQRLFSQSGLARWDNPILDAAWARYPFKPDDRP